MRRTVIFAILAALAITGCGGSGTTVTPPNSTPIPTNRIVYLVSRDASNTDILSCTPDGNDRKLHGTVSSRFDIQDVDASGQNLLAVVENSDHLSVDVQLIGLDGSKKAQLTNLSLEDIVSVRYNRTFSKFVVSGTYNGGAPVIVTANANGSGLQMVEEVAELATFTTSGSLAVGGLTKAEVPQPFVGTMLTDGSLMTKLVSGIQPLEMDEYNGNVVYSASVGGDASNQTGISTVPTTGGVATNISSPTTGNIDAYPKFTLDGARVTFIRSGLGIMSVLRSGGLLRLISSEPNVEKIVRIR